MRFGKIILVYGVNRLNVNLDYLFDKGGSSGGARPKILTNIKDEYWNEC